MAIITTVEQRITATNDWNGAVPAIDPVDDEDIGLRSYPIDTVGGRFGIAQFGFTNQLLWVVEKIVVNFNGVATKSVAIRNTSAGSLSYYLFDSIVASENRWTNTDKIVLCADEYIEILSTAAATEMQARVSAQPYKHKV